MSVANAARHWSEDCLESKFMYSIDRQFQIAPDNYLSVISKCVLVSAAIALRVHLISRVLSQFALPREYARSP